MSNLSGAIVISVFGSAFGFHCFCLAMAEPDDRKVQEFKG